jgi:hypothetical protein
MTFLLFEAELRHWDRGLRLQKQILLLADNCPAHPVLENLDNIKAGVFPCKHYKRVAAYGPRSN